MKRGAIVLLFAASALLTTCGEETALNAAEFVERANQAGAGLELREQLYSSSAGVDVWSVSLTGGPGVDSSPSATDSRVPGASGAATGADLAHGAGSIAVAPDAEMAAVEYDRCQQSATLVCFRGANVVLRLEGATQSETSRLEDAVSSVEPG